VIFESLPGVETVLVSVEPSRPDAWKKKQVREVIEKLRRKGRPVVLKPKGQASVMFLPQGITKGDVLKDIRIVLDWKEKTYGSASIHN
jgi:hypothetical protein